MVHEYTHTHTHTHTHIYIYIYIYIYINTHVHIHTGKRRGHSADFNRRSSDVSYAGGKAGLRGRRVEFCATIFGEGDVLGIPSLQVWFIRVYLCVCGLGMCRCVVYMCVCVCVVGILGLCRLMYSDFW